MKGTPTDRPGFLEHLHRLVAGETQEPCAVILPGHSFDAYDNDYGPAGISFFIEDDRIAFSDQARGMHATFASPYVSADWEGLNTILDEEERIASQEKYAGQKIQYLTNYMKMPIRAMTPPWE